MSSNSTSKSSSRRKKSNQTSYFPKQKNATVRRRQSNASSASSASSTPRSIVDGDTPNHPLDLTTTPDTPLSDGPLVDDTQKFTVPVAHIAAFSGTPTRRKSRPGKGITSNVTMMKYPSQEDI